jgi:hypothetical protein
MEKPRKNLEFWGRLLMPEPFVEDDLFIEEVREKREALKKAFPKMSDEAFDDLFYNALCAFIFKQAHSLMVGDKQPSIDFFLDSFTDGDFAHVIKTFCKISLKKRSKEPPPSE